MLVRKYAIAHATLQLECVGCESDALHCELDAPREVEKAVPQ